MVGKIRAVLREVHRAQQGRREGAPAAYIPELANVHPDHFGISVRSVEGFGHHAGDSNVAFTIQSISKAFVYGMVLEEHGAERVAQKVGVEPSGEAFDAFSLEPGTGRPRNPMINAGAIATTGLVTGESPEHRFERIRRKLSAFAGRELGYDAAVYRSESATGFRNRAIAHLLRTSGILEAPVTDVVETYFKQCAVTVTCDDLAVMAATLADGGRNPLTKQRVIAPENADRVLRVMSACGMYDHAGTWLYEVGLPAKSGVGGGIIGVMPGLLGVATFSPRLDEKGNSIRGLHAFRDLARRCDLHLFNPVRRAG